MMILGNSLYCNAIGYVISFLKSIMYLVRRAIMAANKYLQVLVVYKNPIILTCI